MKKNLTDLERFIQLYGVDTHRSFTGRVEYRVGNLDQSLHEARRLIKVKNLALDAMCTGNMAQIRAFEVIERNQPI